MPQGWWGLHGHGETWKKNELKGKRMTDFTETRGSCIIMLTLLSKVLKPGVPKMGCLHSKSGVPWDFVNGGSLNIKM